MLDLINYEDKVFLNENTDIKDINKVKADDLNEIKTKTNLAIKLLNNLYPVGAIYMSFNDINPSTFIGGTWERIQNVFLLGASSTYEAGSTGGEATHALTINEMPSHNHNITGKLARSEASSGNNYNLEKQRFVVGRNKFSNSNTSATNSSASFINVSDVETSTMLGISSTGKGQAHNNMPPYLAVYMWKRIS